METLSSIDLLSIRLFIDRANRDEDCTITPVSDCHGSTALTTELGSDFQLH